MPTYYVRNGDQKMFSSGCVTGFIMVSSAKDVRVYGYRSDSGRIEELFVGQRFSVDEILPERLVIVPTRDYLGEFTLQNVDEAGEALVEDVYEIVSFPLFLDCDADRDGIVGFNESEKSSWSWSASGRGAILLVNNDKEVSDTIPIPGQRSEFGELIVRSTGRDTLPENFELRLYSTPSAARRFAVFRAGDDGKLTKVLGRRLNESEEAAVHFSEPLAPSGERLYVEAHQYPDAGFEGLITIELHLRLLRDDMLVGPLLASDRVVYRVAPWIMLPNTLPVEEVYTCESPGSNEAFLKGLQCACDDLSVPLTVFPPDEHWGDIWIQDEIEIGYSEAPSHQLHVVFDSPRDRGLDDLPERRLLGADFGHFQIGGSTPNSLDSFGNLEVSPPVTVRGKHYPLGRIVFGGRYYGDFTGQARQMMPTVRQFLYAQKVQSPIEIYTDWLWVGHVDEIVCFVPDDGEKGFKMLLASPRSTRNLLRKLQSIGHGPTVMFEGKRIETTVDDLLADEEFWDGNDVFQEYMNLNRASLEKHLELAPSDFVEIPVLFQVRRTAQEQFERTVAFFPDMVNHLVVGNTSIVPKPYGPVINHMDGTSECRLEAAFRALLPNRNVRFIDDWHSYHELLGEVHCGTNVRRTPPSGVHWWQTLPDGSFDIQS